MFNALITVCIIGSAAFAYIVGMLYIFDELDE